MDYVERRVSGEIKYKGVIVTVRLDQAELVNGKIVKREVVEHPGGVSILPVDENGVCTLVRQFRYPFGRVMLEVPAGKLEYGEDPDEAAARELSEETGLTAGRMLKLGAICTSPGISSEVLHLYLALDLQSGKSHPDEDEFLKVVKMPLEELVALCMSGEVDDAKTVAAALKADKLLSGS